LQTTNSSYLVKGALGEPMHMAGVIMGCETVDTAGEQLLLVVPGESVFSSKLKESLISVAVLMEAGFDVVFRIPTDAILDEVDPILHPDYGGHITTPDGRQVMMIYFDKTWPLPQRASLQHSRSPPPRYHESLNPFSCLAQDDDDNNDTDNMACPQSDTSQHSDLSEVEQRQFELRQNRQAAVQNLHNSFGHPNNQALLQHCQHAKIGTRYLKRYILSFECAFCQAALGRRSYIKRQKAALPPPAVPAPLLPSPLTIIPDVLLHPFKGSRLNLTALSKSDITITEALSEECATCTVGPATASAYTDLRMDWGDACSIGRNGEQYFFCWWTRIPNIMLLSIRLLETLLWTCFRSISISLAGLFVSYEWTMQRNLLAPPW
jgi:hypothetical protein